MCIANHFAMLEMKAIMGAIWRDFRTRAVDGERMLSGLLG